MLNQTYESICENIIKSTMKHIDTSKMYSPDVSKYAMLNSHTSQVYQSMSELTKKICENAAELTNGYYEFYSNEYKNAVTDSAPITLVYAPSGSGRLDMISRRVQITPDALVLTLSTARAAKINNDYGIPAETFSDFTKNLLIKNLPMRETFLIETNLESLINKIDLSIKPKTDSDAKLKTEFLDILRIANNRDRLTTATLFVNKNIKWIIDTVQQTGFVTTKLAAMICQNMIWYFEKTPYTANAIIIDGVHNMPVPTLCSVLAYAYKHSCNLFIIGYPDEAICEFNMAYKNAMNMLSAYTDKNIHIIRLSKRIKMNSDIQNILLRKPYDPKNISYAMTEYETEQEIKSILWNTLDPNTSYIHSMLMQKKQVMIIARSKKDIADIRSVITERYMNLYPDLKIVDLTLAEPESFHYGQMAVKLIPYFKSKFKNPAIMGQYWYEMYNMMYAEYELTKDPQEKARRKAELDNLKAFSEETINPYDLFKDGCNAFARIIINKETQQYRSYMENMEKTGSQDTKDADIILSTIHAASELRCDNVVIFIKNSTQNIDENLYNVALSRANISEYIIIANKGKFKIPLQLYLQQNTITNQE